MTAKPFTVERRGNGHRQKHPMPKPQKWSHQRELESLIGKKISLTFTCQDLQVVNDVSVLEPVFVIGMLVNADAFTVQIAFDNKSVVTYFKHSIRSFSAV